MKRIIILLMLVFSITFAGALSGEKYSHPEFEKMKTERLGNPLSALLDTHPDEMINSVKVNDEQFLLKINQIEDGQIDTLFLPIKIKTTDEKGNEEIFTYTYDSKGNKLTELKERWLIGQWVNVWRITNSSYDKKGNRLTSITEEWQSDQWVNSKRETKTYSSKGYRLSLINEVWQGTQWVKSKRTTNTYDSKGIIFTELYEKWQDSLWINIQQNSYTYNSFGKMLIDLCEVWTGDKWIKYTQFTWTYDSRGNRLTWLSEALADGWGPRDRGTLTYDSIGNCLKSHYEHYNPDNWFEKWETKSINTYTYDHQRNKLTELHKSYYGFTERYTYTYDNNRYLLTSTQEKWQDSIWVNSIRETNSYDNYGNMLTFKMEKWQDTIWVNSNRETNTYDINGNILSSYNDIWEGNIWMFDKRIKHTYDNNANLLIRLIERFFESDWILSNEYFEYKTYSFSDRAKIEIIWSTIITNVNENNEYYSLQISPNPASDFIEISVNSNNYMIKGAVEEIRIYDVFGLDKTPLPPFEKWGKDYSSSQYSILATQYSCKIDISSLPPGVYFVRAGGKVGKFVKI